MEQERILITGAGFIGSAVVRHILDSTFEVVNIDKLTYAGNINLFLIICYPRDTILKK